MQTPLGWIISSLRSSGIRSSSVIPVPDRRSGTFRRRFPCLSRFVLAPTHRTIPRYEVVRHLGLEPKGTISARGARAPTRKRTRTSLWACCTSCQAWRRLAVGTPAPAEEQPWTCAQARRGCSCAAAADERSSGESTDDDRAAGARNGHHRGGGGGLRAVEQLDARSGKVLNRFRSQATAARAADILWSCTIGTVCRAGKGTAGGFGWRFARSVWACCSDCGVWRRLALGTPAPAEDERWTCAQAGRGCTCAAPPDELSSDESLESGDGSSSSSSEDEGPEDATQALPPADATRGRAGQRVGHDGAEVRDHEIGTIAAERSASCQ